MSIRVIIILLLIAWTIPILAQSKASDATLRRYSNKTVRANVHYILKSDGTGNFRPNDDGNGVSTYNGYLYAFDMFSNIDTQTQQNIAMDLPIGNTTPVDPINIKYIIDAVYYINNDALYEYNSLAIPIANFKNGDSVINIFLNNQIGRIDQHGIASPSSIYMFTVNANYWNAYNDVISNGFPIDWTTTGAGHNTHHELGHLGGLAHTMLVDGNNPCCALSCVFDPCMNCVDDGCADTPTVEEIVSVYGCAYHPAFRTYCGFNSDRPLCSNNLMDYSGFHALTPCQIGKLHDRYSGPKQSYLVCKANTYDMNYGDLGYPKVSYYGKVVNVGTITTASKIENAERIYMYYSDKVNLNNFEVKDNSFFEIVYEAACF